MSKNNEGNKLSEGNTFVDCTFHSITKQEEIAEEDILKAAECLDDAPVPEDCISHENIPDDLKQAIVNNNKNKGEIMSNQEQIVEGILGIPIATYGINCTTLTYPNRKYVKKLLNYLDEMGVVLVVTDDLFTELTHEQEELNSNIENAMYDSMRKTMIQAGYTRTERLIKED